jgi:hypothetical protein
MRHSITALVLLALAGGTVASSGAHTGASPSGTTYASWQFKPAFTVQVPAGWIVSERDERGTQIWRRCNTCPHLGEDNGEVTLDMALGRLTLSKAVAQLRKAENIHAGPVRHVRLGALAGLGFTANRTGGDVLFADSGYNSEPQGEPFDVYAVTAAGRTLTIFIDPHASHASAARAFTASAIELVKTLRFKSS